MSPTLQTEGVPEYPTFSNYYRVGIVSVLYSYNSRSSYVLTQGSVNLFEKTQVPH
jgi:hypothetical protein